MAGARNEPLLANRDLQNGRDGGGEHHQKKRKWCLACCSCCSSRSYHIAVQMMHLLLYSFAVKLTPSNVLPNMLLNLTCGLDFGGANCTAPEVVTAASHPLMFATLIRDFAAALTLAPLALLAQAVSQKLVLMIVVAGLALDQLLLGLVASTPWAVVAIHGATGLFGNECVPRPRQPSWWWSRLQSSL